MIARNINYYLIYFLLLSLFGYGITVYFIEDNLAILANISNESSGMIIGLTLLSYLFTFLFIFYLKCSLGWIISSIFVSCVALLSTSSPLSISFGAIYLFIVLLFRRELMSWVTIGLIIGMLCINTWVWGKNWIFAISSAPFCIFFCLYSIISIITQFLNKTDIQLNVDLVNAVEPPKQRKRSNGKRTIQRKSYSQPSIKNTFDYQKMMSSDGMNINKKTTVTANPKKTKAIYPKTQKLQVVPELNKVTVLSKDEQLATHRSFIKVLRKERKQLPKELSDLVSKICLHADVIIENMHNDERDFQPGHRFLIRYLPITQNIMNNFSSLFGRLKNDKKKKELIRKVQNSLQNLMYAFAEKENRLLENDFTDLDVEINTVNNLLKMEGFKTESPSKSQE